MTSAPARLFVLLAREAPVGVIFRRGPRRWVQLIKWKTDTDTFEPGQWIKGELHERRSDLSPDGSLLSYYLEQRHRPFDETYGEAWTAISKPPYFTALALWPDSYLERGGGVFLDSNTFALLHNTNLESSTGRNPHPNHQPPKGMKIAPFESTLLHTGDRYVPIESRPVLSDDMVIHYERLIRGGWEWVKTGSHAKFKKTNFYDDKWLNIWERQVGHLRLRLTLLEPNKIVPGRTYPLDYELIDTASGESHSIEAHWMDWDQQGRLVYALGGKLFEAASSGGSVTSREIADFTANTFESIIAPEWAKTW